MKIAKHEKLSQHRKFQHPDVTGETDPVKIKKLIDDVEAANAVEMERIKNERRR